MTDHNLYRVSIFHYDIEKWTHWHENGQIDKEKYYNNGECVSGDCDKL